MGDIKTRRLLVTADDFGIGTETSRGILDLAARRVVTSTVFLVNSPHAVECAGMWHRSGGQLELGWHPCLTLDGPVAPASSVPSLVDERGQFHPLGVFLKKLLRGRIVRSEVEIEFRAQLDKFLDLVGSPPANVNAHHHVHIFEPVGSALRTVLQERGLRPFIRRVMEPHWTLARVQGARVKRMILSRMGRRSAKRQAAAGHHGADFLIGVTDPPFVRNPSFFLNWIRRTPGQLVELTCHPGYLDGSIEGRDGSFSDGQLHRRQHEYENLRNPNFLETVEKAGFTLTNAAELSSLPTRSVRRKAS